MLEDFEEAYCAVCDVVEEIAICWRGIVRNLIYISVPIWIIPYAIYKAKKGGGRRWHLT